MTTQDDDAIGEPQVFMAMPQRGSISPTAYEEHLIELLGYLGLESPALEGSPRQRRSWQLRSARLISKAIPARPPAEIWFRPLLSAVVLEPDPSHNRFLVEPALAAFGRHRVQAALIEFLTTGTNAERGGAANAWYWTGLPNDYWTGPYTPAPDEAAERKLNNQWLEEGLHVFNSIDDDDVRRCLISMLDLDVARAPERLREAVLQAIQIARTHPDAYIRHRLGAQIGMS